MKSSNVLAPLLIMMLVASCGGGGGGSSAPPSNPGDSGDTGDSGSGSTEPNVLAITVPNDPSYPNKPTVSVTVCTPGTSNCQKINNILLDTGSYGLRIFNKTPLKISLPQVYVGSAPIAECVAYLDGSGNWGPVQRADVKLNGETASNVPIQVINAAYFAKAIPPECRTPNVNGLDQFPSKTGYNGILGVGLFAEDCGDGCAGSTDNGQYFTCRGSKCTGIAVPLESQVHNPVALLSQNNNGVIVQMSSVPPGGAITASGKLILGIGTQTNNTPSGVTAYLTNDIGEFTTVFNGSTFSDSFIDSGSNGLFFQDPTSSLPPCPSYEDWYCPPSTLSLSATNYGSTGLPSGDVSFSIGNAIGLFSSSNSAFAELGGPSIGSGFDWGLPFFFGRSVLIGINGTSSSVGSGPYWAY